MKDKTLKPAEQLPQYTDALISWYAQHVRPLPWREQPTPYRVWVSEIMLQQTRIEAVLPYFERFMKALPTVSALAEADEDSLLKLWEGLGYYSRVRNLQKAARLIMERHNGQLPASFEQLLDLPGIGEYTAGAVSSIAFGIPVPAVDGNVLRVLARLVASYDDIMRPAVKKEFTAIAQHMISVKHPGAFNQAIMELGETVCLPNTVPKCELCPLTAVCIGYKTGCASSLPIRSPKKARRIEQRTVLVLVAVNPVSSEKAVLLHRRLSSGLLAGMWELPNTDSWLDADQAAELVREFGGEMTQFQPLETGRHIFSHIEWHLHGYYIPVPYFTAPKEYQWVSGSQLATEYALPTAFRTYSQILPIWLE